MQGPFASYILDPKQARAAWEDFERRKKRNREMDHNHWIYGDRRKKRRSRRRASARASSSGPSAGRASDAMTKTEDPPRRC